MPMDSSARMMAPFCSHGSLHCWSPGVRPPSKNMRARSKSDCIGGTPDRILAGCAGVPHGLKLFLGRHKSGGSDPRGRREIHAPFIGREYPLNLRCE
jgi:hypothetical protein